MTHAAFHAGALGALERKCGNLELALSYLDKALELTPRHPAACVEKAIVLRKQGKPGAADRFTEKAIRETTQLEYKRGTHDKPANQFVRSSEPQQVLHPVLLFFVIPCCSPPPHTLLRNLLLFCVPPCSVRVHCDAEKPADQFVRSPEPQQVLLFGPFLLVPFFFIKLLVRSPMSVQLQSLSNTSSCPSLLHQATPCSVHQGPLFTPCTPTASITSGS